MVHFSWMETGNGTKWLEFARNSLKKVNGWQPHATTFICCPLKWANSSQTIRRRVQTRWRQPWKNAIFFTFERLEITLAWFRKILGSFQGTKNADNESTVVFSVEFSRCAWKKAHDSCSRIVICNLETSSWRNFTLP